ncbi:Cathepsin Z [Tetrabaena socialis]|uniref:Cathepsin Z n=1 Tax=Tetrabaena socialis TaxID=47790 RepID=A0A2J8A2Q6_9CHLO|nr:Cathepsin Z [Tetrabaena socialis]|eukprot:PNH06800.1 Cathepsin Z [Tetrabaena socialis]
MARAWPRLQQLHVYCEAGAAGLLLAAALITLLAATVDAHGYRDKSLRKPIAPERRFHNHVPAPLTSLESMPRNWNWCDHDGQNWCTANWNQHIPNYCGSCWVHGSLSMIQDRLKVKKRGKSPDVMLGRQTLLNCASYEGYGNGCDGGDTVDVFGYMNDAAAALLSGICFWATIEGMAAAAAALPSAAAALRAGLGAVAIHSGGGTGGGGHGGGGRSLELPAIGDIVRRSALASDRCSSTRARAKAARCTSGPAAAPAASSASTLSALATLRPAPRPVAVAPPTALASASVTSAGQLLM